MAQRGRISILLVEDSPIDAELARYCLRNGRIPSNVTWMRDGQDALDYILRNALPTGSHSQPPTLPDLILLDLDLPKMGGLELVRRLKANSATKRIPIIIMTGSKADYDVIDSTDLGTNGYLVKPLEFDTLMAATRALGLEWSAGEQVGQSRPAKTT